MLTRFREQMGSLLEGIGHRLRPLQEAAGLSTIDPDEDKYRRLGGKPGDLPPYTHQRMVEICRYLYDTNPFAGRILDFLQEFVLGEGVKVKAQEEEVMEILTTHWEDEANRWEEDIFQFLLEWALSGELCFTTATNPHSGLVRLGAQDPLTIERVEYEEKDIRRPLRVVFKSASGGPGKGFDLIGREEDPKSPQYSRLTGEVFWFPFKKLWSQERGRSVLYNLADGLDAHEQYLFDRLERARLLQSFLWDVTLEGASEERIRQWLKDNPKPRPGMTRAHNEKIHWNVVAPHLNAADGSIEERMMRLHILGGAGFPEHWFGEGRETTRATATAMGFPTIKRLTAIQRRFKGIVHQILQFQIDEAVKVGRLEAETDSSFTVFFPSIDEKDITAASTSFQLSMTSLVVAGQNGWISDEEARSLIVLLFGLYGVEIPSALPAKPSVDATLEAVYRETALRRVS